MLLRSILIFLCFVTQGLVQAGTILVWGDSLSAGYQMRSEQAWPVLLQERLNETGHEHTVINASVSGETTDGGLTRLPVALEQHQPDIFILELGGNDGLRGLPPTVMSDNLNAMITAAHEAGSRVLLIGLDMPPNYGAVYNRRFRAAFDDLAEQHNLPYVPMLLDGFADQPEYFFEDGIHPTVEAQPLILDTVWEKLEPMLE